MVIDATGVFSGWHFDGSAEKDGSFSIKCADDVTGSNTVIGSSGNDYFSFTQGVNYAPFIWANYSINGGPGFDTVDINADLSSAVKFSSTTMVNVEAISLAAGHSYNLTTDDATVAAGQRLAISGSGLGAGDRLIFNGAAETNGHFQITGGLGADSLTGGALSDVFVYQSAAQSSGTTCDAIAHLNFNMDKLDVGGTIHAIDATVHGALSTASFNADLAAEVSGHLVAGSVMLATANSGTLSGQTVLVVDQNGIAGYQAGGDLVIHLYDYTGALATSTFI